MRTYNHSKPAAKAFESGELDKSGMDVSLSVRYDENLTDVENDKRQENPSAKSDIEYGEPITQCLTLLGIPWEWS